MDPLALAIPIVRQVAKREVFQRPLDRLLAPFNPFSHRRFSDPYPEYEQARAVGALFDHRRTRFWLATGYEEGEAVLRGPVSVDRSDVMAQIRPYSKLAQFSLETMATTMLMTDPPDHTRLRKLVNRAFTPRAVAALEPRIEEITHELLDDLGKDGRSVDAMVGFANVIPIYTIGEMLGLPRGERARLKKISDVVAQYVDPINGFDPREMDAAIADFDALLGELISERQAKPTDDLLSALLAVEEDGDRLSRSELISMVLLLMVAGHETTSGLIGSALVALERNPAARAQLVEEPDLAENAVEELLRFDSPVQATDRLTLESFDVAGQTVPAGAGIVVLLGAANRDPRRYDAPNELRLDRTDPRPLSFGHGIHHCLGAALARLEARIAIPAFIEAHPGYAVDHDAIVWKRSVSLRGPERLPVML